MPSWVSVLIVTFFILIDLIYNCVILNNPSVQSTYFVDGRVSWS